MVEDLPKELSREQITKENLNTELFRMELIFKRLEIESNKKVDYALEKCSNEILEWWIEDVGRTSGTWEMFKSKVKERFLPRATISDLIKEKQNYNEKLELFVERMIKLGKSARADNDVIEAAIHSGIRTQRLQFILATREATEIKDMLPIAKIMDKEMEQRNLALKNKDNYQYKNNSKEKGEDNRKGNCYICKSASHYANKCPKKNDKANNSNSVNEIETSDDFDNNFIEINNSRYYAIIDSGSYYSFISQDYLNQLNLIPFQVKKRYFETVLNEKFGVEKIIEICFKFKDVCYYEKFYIFPDIVKRKIILGRNFIKNTNMKFNQQIINNRIRNQVNNTICKTGIVCEINTKDNEKVVQGQKYFPQAFNQRIQEEVNRLLEKGYIRKSESTWLNPIRPVEKPNGSIRLCINLMKLNKIVEKDNYSLPRIESIITSLNGKQYFSKLDLKEGFFQIPIKQEHCHKTAFRVNHVLYEWTRMPMGFKNSPAIFQRVMDNVLGSLIGTSCFVYVDDILIFGKTEKEHDTNLELVNKKLKEFGIETNEDKAVIMKQQIEFLGYRISKDKITMKLNTKQGIENLKEPKDKIEIQKFLGIVNYYRKFIKNLAEISEPLLKLTRKSTIFEWNEDAQKSFDTLKNILKSENILTQPDFNRNFILTTDASNTGLGAILSQEVNGKEITIAFASRTLNSSERNYSITEKEMLGAIWAMEHFEYYLKGREFVLITDHKALEALNSKNEIKSQRIQRWIERINNFDFTVKYIKGENLPHVDALSRNSINNINNSEMNLKKMEEIILKKHEDLVHRGKVAVAYDLKKIYNWKNMDKIIENTLKNCLICKKYSRKRKGGEEFVESFNPFEKIAIDFIGPINNKMIITGIDYFTRFGFAKVVNSKETIKVVEFLNSIYNNFKFKELVCDNAKEFTSNNIKSFLNDKKIKQHLVSPYAHESNGRIERFNLTLQDGIRKLKGTLKSRINTFLKSYNNTYHSGIKLTPIEANLDENLKFVKLMNLKNNEYTNRFGKSKREKFNVGEQVLIKKEIRTKLDAYFDKLGLIKQVLNDDSYIVEVNGKKMKRKHNQLKLFSVGERDVEY